MNKTLEDKIMELINYARENDLSKTLEFIDRVFIEKPDDINAVTLNTDYYVVNRAIYRLNDNSPATLIVSYPEGDRLGSKYADPGIDIYFDLGLESRKRNRQDLYIIRNGAFNSNNNIFEHIELICNEYKPNKKEIIFQLTEQEGFNHFVQKTLLNSIPDELLADKDVKGAIMENLWRISLNNKNLFDDQYMYGRYGGEDVPNWKRDEVQWFMKLKEDVPKRLRIRFRIEFADEVHNYLKNQRTTKNAKEMVI